MVLRKIGLKEDNMQYFSFDSVLIGEKTKNTLWEKIIDWFTAVPFRNHRA